MQTGCTRRSRAGGSDRSSSAPATAARRGRRREVCWKGPRKVSPKARATSSPTTRPRRRASPSRRISGTTARSIPGSSSASGISSRHSPIRIRRTPGWKTLGCFARATAARHGRSSPGAGGMCLHTILLDPSNPRRMYVAISAAGAFRTDDGGNTWKPINRGLHSQYIPDPNAEVGHCVHRIALHRSRPNVLFMQKHWDVMRSDDAGESWQEVSGNLPTDFGFPIDIHAHEPNTVYVVPIKSDSEHYPPEGRLRVYRSRTGGHEWEALTKGLPQRACYVNVLRDAMAIDSLDGCGVYFGTTGGQVYASNDAGDTWAPIVRDLPAVLSVEVQTLS